MIFVFFLLLFSNNTYSQEFEYKNICYGEDCETKSTRTLDDSVESKIEKLPKIIKSNSHHFNKASNVKILSNDTSSFENIVKVGDQFDGYISQRILVSRTLKSPIKVNILGDKINYFSGTARLDEELKRVIIDLDHYIYQNKHYDIKASILSDMGEIGLKGNHTTHDKLYFAGELITAGGAAFSDLTMDRSQNNLGNYQVEPTLQNASKAALSSSLTKTSERLGERAKNAPEYTEIEAFRRVKIYITERAKRKEIK